MSAQANRPPEDIMAEQCLVGRTCILSRVVSGVLDKALHPAGLNSTQLTLLVLVAKVGIAKPEAICEMLFLDPSTLSQNIEPMKAQGWLEVVGDNDGGAQSLRVTTRGQALFEQAYPLWEEGQDQVKKQLGPEAVQVIFDTIAGLRAASAR